jgi:hypothetical protein
MLKIGRSRIAISRAGAAIAGALLAVTPAIAWSGGALAGAPGRTVQSSQLGRRPLGRFVATQSMSFQRFNHTATILRDGSVLVAGGENAPEILRLTELYDPSSNAFSRTGALKDARKDHTATLLNDGRVLIAGGDDEATVMSSAEIFNPATGAFDSAGAMVVPRTFHTATRLSNGGVLIAGGSASIAESDPQQLQLSPSVSPLDTVEIFDPADGKFFVGFFTMQVARAMHTATALEHGREVLVIGGLNLEGGVEASTELYDTRTGLFTPSGAMGSPRYGHTATLLNDGTVLVTGGLDENGTLLNSAEIYNPRSGFSATGQMNHARAFHTATLLNTGQVLITGGSATLDQNPGYDRSAEIYDPQTGVFTPAPGVTDDSHVFLTATLLGSGKVLIDGGTTCCAGPRLAEPPAPFSTQAQLFDPKSETFGPFIATSTYRAFHTATRLQDGRVLVVGGENLRAGILSAAERYASKLHAFSPTGVMNSARAAHTATLINCSVSGCPDGQVLIAGGIGVSNGAEVELSSAELYDLTNGSFTPTGALTTARDSATATALSDGRILIAGGEGFDSRGNPAVLDSAEVYDPAAQTFSCVGGAASGSSPACNSSMTTPRILHSAALLPDGAVLLAGGLDNNGNILGSAELFEPGANGGPDAFTALGPAMTPLQMNTPRVAHSATYLDPQTVAGPRGGMVLIAGGSFDLSAELYDPSTGTFSCVSGNPGACNASMRDVRFLHTATLLDSGLVLFAGGSLLTARGQLFPESSAELFDPAGGAAGSFTSAGNMTTPRVLHTATLLGGNLVSGSLAGNVLIVGGEQVDATLMSAELFNPPPTHR